MTKAKPLFECATCSRCGGSGRHSFNQISRDTCFKCNGSGWALTRRGSAAQEYLNSMRSQRADAFKVGDLMLCETMSKRFFAVITEIKDDTGSAKSKNFATGEWETPPRLLLTCGDRYGFSCDPGTMIRRGFDAEAKKAQIADALAFQETLTKTGAPRRRA